MNENAGQFRSAAIGGFHRQDVLDYFERITRENQEEKDAILAEKDAAAAALEEERAARARAENRLLLLEQRAENASAGCKDLEEEIAGLKERLAEKEEALAQARAEGETLRKAIQELKPAAQSWQRIKDTAGDIEVAAHERAQITIQEAQVKAAEIRAEAARWVLDIQNRCDKLQQDLRSSILAAEKELDSVRASFSLAETDMEGFQSALSELVAGIEQP